jgi:hypothetical protein
MRIPIVIAETVRAFIARSGLVLVLAFGASSLFIISLWSETPAQEMAFSRTAEEAAARLAQAFPTLQGSVVGIDADRVLIDLGSKQKVYQGMELQVYREGEDVKHPVSGQILGKRDRRVGLLRVVEVREGFSETTAFSRQEGSTITPGDLVRVSHDRLLVALPTIDAGEVKGANVSSLTKDVAIALAKTGRFIVIEEHLIRATLMGEKPSRSESFTDPSTLKVLSERARAQLLALGKLSATDQGIFLDLQVVSVSSGAPLTVASVEVAGSQPGRIAAPSATPAPVPSQKSAPPFVRVQPQPGETAKAAEQAKSPLQEKAPAHKPAPAGVAADVQRKPGTPSFLIKGEDASGQSGDQGSKDHVTFDLTDALLAVAAGDLDGDRRPEVVGITDSEVIVYRWNDRQLTPIARIGGQPSFVRNLHLDVGDVNGGGRAQIFVTALSSVPEGLKLRNSLRSFVLELRGDKLVRIADGLDYFLRLLAGPGIDAPILIAQRMGHPVPFEGPIVRLSWSGERYVEERPLSLPAQVKGLYDFAPLEVVGDQVLEVAAIAEQRIRTYGRGGGSIWEGKDDLGEVDHLAFFHIPDLQNIRPKHGIRSGIPANPEEYADRLVLPRRILVEASPLFGDAKAQLLTLANSTKYGIQVSLGGGPPPSGRVIAYDRRDGSITRGWETVPVEGQVRDVTVLDLNGAGRRDLVLLSAVKDKGFVASLKDKSRGIINVFSFTR